MATRSKRTGRKKKGSAKKALSGTAKKGRQSKQSTSPKRKQAEQIVLTTILAGVAGVAGYFGWRYLKKRMAKKEEDTLILPPITPPVLPPVKEPKTSSGGTTQSRNDDFPLKKGSKGENVKTLQRALIEKFGSKVLPKYGADGDFGSETAAALKKNGYSETINESTFNLITQGGGVSDPGSLAQKLLAAASSKNFSTVMSLLSNLKTKQDYQDVSSQFVQNRLRGVRQTLVNGLLSSFSNAEQKQKIGMEFVRMGLRYDGSKYSLSGFDGRPIITVTASTVWVSGTQSVQVPPSMVLGNEVGKRLDYTMFENNNKYFLVKTDTIKYL